MSRDASPGLTRPRLRRPGSEQERSGDEQVEQVAARLEDRGPRPVADEPVEESAHEAVIVQDERRVPRRRRLRKEAHGLEPADAGTEHAGGQEQEKYRGDGEDPP